MPKNKDLKRLVRSRMEKTGESYAAAHRHITKLDQAGLPAIVPEAQYAELAGMSDDAVWEKTGRTWKRWVSVLDAVDAHAWPHREIAKHLREVHDVGSWWAQSVTVAYERIRGLRDVGQRRGGSYDANKSKTFPVSAATLHAWFAQAPRRAKWLPDVTLKVRTSQAGKSVRLTWVEAERGVAPAAFADTSVQVYLSPKGDAKCAAQIQHSKLADRNAVERAKEFWHERLGELARQLR